MLSFEVYINQYPFPAGLFLYELLSKKDSDNDSDDN